MSSSLEHLLTCDVCLDTYDEPKLLPACGHVFCEKCLSPLVDYGVITCPKCRKASTVLEAGVSHLNTDWNLKDMVAEWKCLDCTSVDRLATKCEQCFITLCPSCIPSHDAPEKCELLMSIREARKKLPTMNERQKLDRLKIDWQKFRERNRKQQSTVNESMTRLIRSLHEQKAALNKKFDEYDLLAEERMNWIEETKDIERSLQDIQKKVSEIKSEDVAISRVWILKHEQCLSRKETLLLGHVPCSLGTVYTDQLEREINSVAKQITRRAPCEDCEPDVIWRMGAGTVDEHEDEDAPLTSRVIAEGEIQILRYRGGRYEVKVLDDDGTFKVFKWNNMAPRLPSLKHRYWTHVPWTLKSGDTQKDYSVSIEDKDARCDFVYALLHSIEK